MANVLCVLYDDPVEGFPPSYARDEVPPITSYPGGQTAPTPDAAGAREILECWFANKPIRDDYLIVDGGKLPGAGAHSYSA